MAAIPGREHQARPGGAVRWTQRRKVIGAAAVLTLAGLVAGGLLALRGGVRAPAAPARLWSPFTGVPVPALDRVLAVKIDNI